MSKKYEWNNLLKIGVILFSALLAVASVYVSFYLIYHGTIPARNMVAFNQAYPWIFLAYMVLNFLFGTYIFYNKRVMDLVYLTILTQLALSALLMMMIMLGGWGTFPRSVIALNFVVGTIVLSIYNVIIYYAYGRIRGQKRILIVGERDRVLEALRNFSMMENHRHQVTHVVLSNYYEQIKHYANEVDIVYLAGYIDEDQRLKIYEFLMHNRKKLFLSTEFENLMMVNPNIMNFQDESIIEVSSFEIPEEEAFLKRSFDILVALILLIIAAPIMIVTAIVIKMDSPGPIFYKQERITLGQRPFNILKFRSMSQTAEAESGPVLATKNDSRITKVGQVIRSTRIDELPQLINVLLGDMSLVGPRPERPFFVNQFVEANPYYSLRHHVRAGITGYAQVYGKYSTNFNSKLNFDLLYIKNYSLAFDFKLLFQTVKILFDKVSSRGLDDDAPVPIQDEWQDFAREMTIIE